MFLKDIRGIHRRDLSSQILDLNELIEIRIESFDSSVKQAGNQKERGLVR